MWLTPVGSDSERIADLKRRVRPSRVTQIFDRSGYFLRGIDKQDVAGPENAPELHRIGMDRRVGGLWCAPDVFCDPLSKPIQNSVDPRHASATLGRACPYTIVGVERVTKMEETGV